MPLTSVTEGHRHEWSSLKERTSTVNGHNHVVDRGRRLALSDPSKGVDHNHKLLSGV